MKTLSDYILDAQRKEARFLGKPIEKTTIISTGTAQNVEQVLHANYTTADGIPCHNKATHDFYSRNK